jgi:hypothetical protein
MPEHPHHRIPSNAGMIRRMFRLIDRELARLEAHYDALEAAPPPAPAIEAPAPTTAPRHPPRRRRPAS